MSLPGNTPVLVGIGEYTEKPEHLSDALEPVDLWAKALLAAIADSGAPLTNEIDSIELVGSVTWRYRDPVGFLCQKLNIDPPRRVNASMGGETPVRLLHEAAIAVSRGEFGVAAIVGGEAMHTMNRARRARATLPWTPLVSKEEAARIPADRLETSPISRRLGIKSPPEMYPFYEVAVQAEQRKTPREGFNESAELWSRYARVAADNPYAWIKNAPDAQQIARVSNDNRLINWPYTKLMVANPMVNQSAAFIVTTLEIANAAGIAKENLIFIWGGAAAAEPDNLLHRDSFGRSSAQAAVLERALEIAGGVDRIDAMELYSCFPVVPKMALRELGITAGECVPTVTGGLTFFGGPWNNYMSHAVCAMVRRLRGTTRATGLLYGQGGCVTKHHALVVSSLPSPSGLSSDYSVQAAADRRRNPSPELLEDYSGPATIETYTVLYGRDGAPIQGVVVLRTPCGRRTMARVVPEAEASLALLTNWNASAVGANGDVRRDAFGKLVWIAESDTEGRSGKRRFTRAERRGRITIITIDRPECMNALHPPANAELADIMDQFEGDPDQWVAIITGAGTQAFCSGNDLKYFASATARGAEVETPESGYAGLTARFEATKPVIAAVNGVAMGGGFEIALACDLIVAADTAVFALPEPKVGLAALAGGLLRLPRQVGLKQAMGMILTGRRIDASEALSLGLVNEVAPQERLLERAIAWAEEILACSPMSLRASKQIVQRGLDESSLADAYVAQTRYPATRALFKSADMREGPRAFAEKRPPKWQGH